MTPAPVSILDSSAAAVEGRAPTFPAEDEVAALDACWAAGPYARRTTSVAVPTASTGASVGGPLSSPGTGDGELANPFGPDATAFSSAALATALSSLQAPANAQAPVQFAAPEPQSPATPVAVTAPGAPTGAAVGTTGAGARSNAQPAPSSPAGSGVLTPNGAGGFVQTVPANVRAYEPIVVAPTALHHVADTRYAIAGKPADLKNQPFSGYPLCKR
jgi:hypothetical protein